MTDGVDISEEVKVICEKLGHKYDCVAELKIPPDKVIAVVYDENEHGSKFRDARGNASRKTITTSTLVRT